jgi:hypothetical protein
MRTSQGAGYTRNPLTCEQYHRVFGRWVRGRFDRSGGTAAAVRLQRPRGREVLSGLTGNLPPMAPRSTGQSNSAAIAGDPGGLFTVAWLGRLDVSSGSAVVTGLGRCWFNAWGSDGTAAVSADCGRVPESPRGVADRSAVVSAGHAQRIDRTRSKAARGRTRAQRASATAVAPSRQTLFAAGRGGGCPGRIRRGSAPSLRVLAGTRARGTKVSGGGTALTCLSLPPASFRGVAVSVTPQLSPRYGTPEPSEGRSAAGRHS